MERQAAMLPTPPKQGIIRMAKYAKGIYGITSGEKAEVGDIFVTGVNQAKNTTSTGKITKVIEQRKEKGTYQDENKRRWWSKVEVQYI